LRAGASDGSRKTAQGLRLTDVRQANGRTTVRPAHIPSILIRSHPALVQLYPQELRQHKQGKEETEENSA
jgi:hypothetical protein